MQLSLDLTCVWLKKKGRLHQNFDRSVWYASMRLVRVWIFPLVMVWYRDFVHDGQEKKRHKCSVPSDGKFSSFGFVACRSLSCLFWVMCYIFLKKFRLHPQAYSAYLDSWYAGNCPVSLGWFAWCVYMLQSEGCVSQSGWRC